MPRALASAADLADVDMPVGVNNKKVSQNAHILSFQASKKAKRAKKAANSHPSAVPESATVIRNRPR